MDDVERIARKVNQIVARGNKFGDTLVQHEANFQSYIATNDHRVDELSDLVLDNHDLMMEVQYETSRVFKRIKRTSEAIIGVIRRMNGETAQKAVKRVSKLVSKTNSDYRVMHDDLMQFYRHKSVEAHLANSSDIWITLKVPVGLYANASKV